MKKLLPFMILAMVTLLPAATYDQTGWTWTFHGQPCEGQTTTDCAIAQESVVREHFITEGWATKQRKFIRSVFIELDMQTTQAGGFAVIVLSNPDSPNRAWPLYHFKTRDAVREELFHDRAFEFDTVYAGKLPVR